MSNAISSSHDGCAQALPSRDRFIIDGIITIPIALYGFFVFPNTPTTTSAFYLSEKVSPSPASSQTLPDTRIHPAQERQLAVSRLHTNDASPKEPHGIGRPTWALAKRVLSRWRWYGCSLLVRPPAPPPLPPRATHASPVHRQFAISGETESFGSNNLMGQWLAAAGGYTVAQRDYYPCGVTAVGIASTLVCATWTDATRSRARWPVLVYMSLAVIVAAACILPWGAPTGLKFFAYCA